MSATAWMDVVDAMRLVRIDRLYQSWLDKKVAKLIEMAGNSPGPTDSGRA